MSATTAPNCCNFTRGIDIALGQGFVEVLGVDDAGSRSVRCTVNRKEMQGTSSRHQEPNTRCIEDEMRKRDRK